jgi:phage FluMu protein Com
MSDGKCPKCEKMISIELRRGPIGNPGTRLVLENGFIAICPHCKTILGVLSDSDNIAEKVALQPASTRTSPRRTKHK